MKKTKETASGFSYEPMPTTMFYDLKEGQLRKNIAIQESDIIRYIGEIRSKGITIKTEEDLKKFTPDYVREQIAESKKKRLQDNLFLPNAIRKREEKEFQEMENELVPLADDVQRLLYQIPFRIHMDADVRNIYFSAEDVDRYVREQCTEQIPEDIRQYYDELQKVCEAWDNLCTWADDHGFIAPNMKLAQTIIGMNIDAVSKPEDLGQCVYSISHEKMLNLYLYGIIRKS